MENIDKKKLWSAISAAVIVVVIIVVISLINILPKIGKVEVYVGYAPFVSEVKLNGEVIENNKKHFLEKGNYNVSVQLEGFEAIEKDVVVDEETTAIFGSMTAITDKGEKIANEHLDDYMAIEGYASIEIQKEGEKMEKKWPIITKLPVVTSLYKVGYIVEGEKITLTVESPNVYMDTAVSKLRAAADAAKDSLINYVIKYEEYDNELINKFAPNSETDAETALKTGFSSVNSFNYTNGAVMGDYYIAKVTAGSNATYSLMTYRVVIKKQDGKWILVSTPEPIVTKNNSTEVPEDVIRAANTL